MSEVVTQQHIKSSALIFYALAVATIIYGLLLYLLDSAVGPSTDATANSSINILPPVFLGVALLQIVAIFKVFMPKALVAETYDASFPLMLISVVMAEAIAMYGLVIGLLDLFAQGQAVQWNIVLGFIGVSFVFQFYLINNKFMPRLQSFLGTPYTPAA